MIYVSRAFTLYSKKCIVHKSLAGNLPQEAANITLRSLKFSLSFSSYNLHCPVMLDEQNRLYSIYTSTAYSKQQNLK